jgi:hypothetical protein
MALIPEGPDKLAEVTAAARRRAVPEEFGDGGKSVGELLGGDSFPASSLRADSLSASEDQSIGSYFDMRKYCFRIE